jgi:hypothetical protein
VKISDFILTQAFILSQITLILNSTHLYAKEFDLGLTESTRVQETVGTYQGEVRLQSSSGDTDRLLTSHVQVSVKISPDSIQIQNTPDLLGSECHSKIGGIRELKKLSNEDTQIFTAEFDFNSGKCFKGKNLNQFKVILWKNEQNEVFLETLLENASQSNSQKLQKDLLYIHGYFTKIQNDKIWKNPVSLNSHKDS